MLSLLLRCALALGCLVYALWGVDLGQVWSAFSRYDRLPLALVTAFSLLCVVPAALRLSFLSRGRSSMTQSLAAVMIGLALNNVFPAKAGELAKLLYLRFKVRIPSSQGLEMVFWERFFDLNALLLLGVASAMFMEDKAVLAPLLALVLGLWVFLAIDRLFPGVAAKALGLLPAGKIRALLADMLDHLRGRLSLPFLGALGLYTVLAWAMYASMVALTLLWVAGLGLTPAQTLTVFAVATLGYAIPSTPGAIGVYEAAFVLALGWFGVGKEEAFAAGLACHALQFIPMTAAGLGVMAASGVRLRDLKRPAAEWTAG